MKLASFSIAGDDRTRIGLVTGDAVADLSWQGVGNSLKQLLAEGLEEYKGTIERAAEKADQYTLEEVHLHAPITHPGKILAIGLNYGDHIAETGAEPPKHQVWFNKQHNCTNGPYDPINLPAVSEQLDYEAELCVIIGRRCKHVPRERAHEVIAGFCCGNDVSVRDWQRRAQTFQIGKSFDTHGPMGPYLVTPDEVGDPHELEIRCTVNGEERQHSNTKHLIFDCYDAIAHLTQAFTLDIGDVLFMGTPAGVGLAMKPPTFLKASDVVRVEIEKLGYIENKVVPEEPVTLIE